MLHIVILIAGNISQSTWVIQLHINYVIVFIYNNSYSILLDKLLSLML